MRQLPRSSRISCRAARQNHTGVAKVLLAIGTLNGVETKRFAIIALSKMVDILEKLFSKNKSINDSFFR
jgi:hypothetical protein